MTKLYKIKKAVFLAVGLLLFSSCSSVKTCKNNYDENYNGTYKIGKAYEIKNTTYYPKKEIEYKQTGLASWYGDDFHCKKTANGQFFNKNELTAAHRTLPLPSVVRVTNLKNNKQIEVIVNDRGPFVKGDNRIIDVSEKAAKELAMKNDGVAKVHVEYLHQETNELLAKLNLHKYVDKNSQNKSIFNKKESKPNRLLLADNKIESIDVNVGNFDNKKEAVDAVKKLSKLGTVRLEHVNIKDSGYYLVKLSSSLSKNKNSNIILEKIKEMGYKKAKLI